MQIADDTERYKERLLARAAQAGDHAAFGQLVQRYQPMIFRLCRRYVASEAEDLAQDTFIRAFVERERFDPRRPLAPWLVTVARNLCIDRLRRKKPEPDSHAAAVAAPGSNANVELHAAAREELARVEQALGELPESQREALLLYHQEGLSYAEVAAALAVPMGTVMTWLHRARQTLRRATRRSGSAGQEAAR